MKPLKKLTPRQQQRVRASVERRLKAFGFKPGSGGDFLERPITSTLHLCVGYKLPDQCLKLMSAGWMIQTTKPGLYPMFGYSGTCHLCADWATPEKVIDAVVDRIHREGASWMIDTYRTKIQQAKEKLATVISSL